jgi:DNA polymerase-3 subunit alpha
MPAIDLHAHSTYSFMDGFGSPKAVVERALELRWKAASLTEHGHLCSVPEFYKECKKMGIKPILGCEMYVVPDDYLGEKGKEFRDKSFHLTVLALSTEGYKNLVAWTSTGYQPENFYYKPRMSPLKMAEIAPFPLHHNVVLSGCLGAELSQMLLNGVTLERAALYVQTMRSLFPNFYIEVQDHYIQKFVGKEFPAYLDMIANEEKVRKKLLALAHLTGTPLVLTNDSHMQWTRQRKAHIAMKAAAWRNRDDTHYGKSLEQQFQGYLKDYAYYGSYLRDMESIAEDVQLPNSAIQNVVEIVEEADIRLDPLDRHVYSIPFSGYDDPISAIRRRAKARLALLTDRHGKAARSRFEHELNVMEDFAHYLLLMSDFIIEAKRQGIRTWTRGSAANSLLCYCLKIHDIDSIDYGLLFERFFNSYRKKAPDIDIDIEQDRYEDFMQQIVIPRMNELEGEGQVVQICNYGTLANRSAFRMAANSLGIPKETQDEISRLLPQMIDSGVVAEEAVETLRVEYPDLYKLMAGIFDAKKSVGQHPCGWLFGTKDRPLRDWVPVYFIASSKSQVTQFDMNGVADMGLTKGDFLRLKSLSVITRTLRAAGLNMGVDEIPVDDSKTFHMIREGKVQGVHTLQGKEVRRGAVETEAENVHDVIRAAAIWRPALTREKKDKLYVERKRGLEIPQYPHEIVERATEDTLGLPVFQEQALEIAINIGVDDEGLYDLYEAIKMAKGQGRGAKAAFSKIRPKFLQCARVRMSEDEAEATWEFVKSYQGYGFNKGHATSYGILAVKMAYLKAHHPLEFYTALLDVFPEKLRYIAAARSEGYRFLPPDVNFSGAGFSFDREHDAIRVGLSRIHGLGPVTVKEILSGQPYRSVDDFQERVSSANISRFANIRSVGGLSSVGMPGNGDDITEYRLLGFCTSKPDIFRGIKLRYAAARDSGSWRHIGCERGVELTDYRESVSKLFWIPHEAKFHLKASPFAQAKSWLLEAVDENGLPFHLSVPEDKEYDVKLLKYLHRKCQGNVVCFDGGVRMPMVQDGPQGFRVYGVTGAFRGDPQLFRGVGREISDEAVAVVSQLSTMRRRSA